MKIKNIVLYIAVLLMFGLIGYGYLWYKNTFSPNTRFDAEEAFVHIPTNSTYNDAKMILTAYIDDIESFDKLANQLGYSSQVFSGRFLLKKDMSNYHIYKALRQNIPVRLVINNQENLAQFTDFLSNHLEPDAESFYQAFTHQGFMDEHEFTAENVFVGFMPDTHEFYWNTTPIEVRNKIVKEYTKFWNQERLQQAEKLGLSPQEVMILASVVQKESAKVDERPKVAGVYLNRLNKGMLLQADPTVIYAKKLTTNDFDQIIKRVYFKDLTIDSPYNTYKYLGLPPGPIAMPDISSVNAVLSPEKHDYIYFCADPDQPGYHAFARNAQEHNQNRAKYIAWLEKNNIE